MKAVILAGGYGTRLSEETSVRPKPMVEIGGMPILWHIMKIYSAHGIHDFVICCGYKGYMIKEYFANYMLRMSDVRIDLRQNKMELFNHAAEPWTVTMVDTGEMSGTGGRLLRARALVGNDPFCFTYGDGLTDADIGKTIAFHKQSGGLATMTAVCPPGRFGTFQFTGNDARIRHFTEKPKDHNDWINGGFFVLEPQVFDYIANDGIMWEMEPLEKMAAEGKLVAYKHPGFWRCMDHLSDKIQLENMWSEGKAPWKVWA